MMVGLQNWFSGRIKYFSLFGLAGLLGLTLALQRYSQNSSNIVTLQDGVQTCFLRVHNSFTARLISKGEGFLSSSFTDTTVKELDKNPSPLLISLAVKEL